MRLSFRHLRIVSVSLGHAQSIYRLPILLSPWSGTEIPRGFMRLQASSIPCKFPMKSPSSTLFGHFALPLLLGDVLGPTGLLLLRGCIPTAQPGAPWLSLALQWWSTLKKHKIFHTPQSSLRAPGRLKNAALRHLQSSRQPFLCFHFCCLASQRASHRDSAWVEFLSLPSLSPIP